MQCVIFARSKSQSQGVQNTWSKNNLELTLKSQYDIFLVSTSLLPKIEIRSWLTKRRPGLKTWQGQLDSISRALKSNENVQDRMIIYMEISKQRLVQRV